MEVESIPVEDERRLTRLRFDAAVKVIKSLPPDGPFQPSNDMMLKFYSYYKQATVGTCDIPRPGFWDAVGKAKWDAWNSLGQMSKEEAMAAYVDEMKLILEGMPMTDEVEELLRVLGPFYELIEEKKKISQISDLSTGFGTMLNSMPSKSVTKSIIRTMEMNGTLETRPTRIKSEEVRARSEGEEEEEEEEEDEDEDEDEDGLIQRREKKSAASQLKKKSSARRQKVVLSNGGPHLTNGSHSRAPNSEDPQEPLLNGHHNDHLPSDSDSEVYCDSVDQFGQEERSLDDLDEEEDPVSLPAEEQQEEVDGAPPVVRCGGEDGESGGAMRQRANAGEQEEEQNRSVVRRGRGSRSAGSGPLRAVHGGGDGDGGHWGGAATSGGNLNEQIVVALARLQEDMQSVLERLHTLEALTASQARSLSVSPPFAAAAVNQRSRKPSWWPFDISPSSLAFAVLWPFVVQWLVRLFLQRRRRRIN